MNDLTKGLVNASWLRLAVTGGVPKRCFIVAVVVGTALNLINQGDVLLSDASLDYLKLGLTYLVPYLVACYGSVTAQLHAQKANHRAREGD